MNPMFFPYNMKIYSKFTNINSTKEVIVLIKLRFFS